MQIDCESGITALRVKFVTPQMVEAERAQAVKRSGDRSR
jgi:hypothetical protein